MAKFGELTSKKGFVIGKDWGMRSLLTTLPPVSFAKKETQDIVDVVNKLDDMVSASNVSNPLLQK